MIKGNCKNCGKEDFITEDEGLCYNCFHKSKILVVDIELKDGTKLNGCAIFSGENKRGETAIRNEDIIEKKFQKLPRYSPTGGMINFQTSMINGYFHVENVKDYKIKWIDNGK